MKYIKDMKDLNIQFIDDWEVVEDQIIYGTCYMDVSDEVIDKYFGIDLMTKCIMSIHADCKYVMNFMYNCISEECQLECDFCGVSNEKYPNGFVYTFKLEEWEKNYLLSLLVRDCSIIKKPYKKDEEWYIRFY